MHIIRFDDEVNPHFIPSSSSCPPLHPSLSFSLPSLPSSLPPFSLSVSKLHLVLSVCALGIRPSIAFNGLWVAALVLHPWRRTLPLQTAFHCQYLLSSPTPRWDCICLDYVHVLCNSCCCIQETPFSGNHPLTLTLTFLPTLLPQRLLVLGRDGTIQELWWFEWEWPT